MGKTDGPHFLRRAAGVAVLYGVAAYVGLTFARFDDYAAAVWPVNAVLLASVLLAPPRELGVRLLLGLIAIVLAGTAGPGRIAVGAVFGLVHVTEVALAALLLRLAGHQSWGELQQPRALIRLVVLGCLLPPAISATLATVAYERLTGVPDPAMFQSWYAAHASGLVIATPPLLMIGRDGWRSLLESCRFAHGGWALLGMVTATVFVFSANYPLLYAVLATVVFVAFRGGFTASAVALLLIATIAILFTVMGLGPFHLVRDRSPSEAILQLQCFLAVAVLTTLPLAAALHQRNELLRALADQAGKDGLTGLATRLRFDTLAALYWSNAQRQGRGVTLALIDVDHFKRYNDIYGHPAGDACLQRVAASLRRAFQRQEDLVARVGGEEFAVMLQGVEPDIAVSLFESIHTQLAAVPISHSGCSRGRVTVSIGVLSVTAEQTASFRRLYLRADELLYQAKRGGRACTVSSTVLDDDTARTAPDSAVGFG